MTVLKPAPLSGCPLPPSTTPPRPTEDLAQSQTHSAFLLPYSPGLRSCRLMDAFEPRHNVTFSRLYKDGGSWKSTQSFGRNDLLLLAKVADQAHSRIFQLALPDDAEATPEDSPAS